MIRKIYFNVLGNENNVEDQNTFSLNYNTETGEFKAIDRTGAEVTELSMGTLNTDGGAPTITLSAGSNISIDDNVINCSLTGLSQLANDPGYVTTDTTYAQGTGVTITSGNVVEVDQEWLEGFVANLGYVKVEDDQVCSADEITINMTGNRVLSVNATWLDNYLDGKAYLTEIPSTYAQLSDIPVIPTNVSEFANDAGYLTEHQDLSEYAQLSDIPVIPENVSVFTNDAGYLIGDDLSAYAQLSDVPVIPEIPTKNSQLINDKGYVTLADLEAVKAMLLEAMVPSNMTIYQDVNSNISDPTKNVFIATSTTLTGNTTFTGKSVTVTELNNENSYTKFTAEGDVTLKNMNNSGTLPKATSNAQVVITTPGRVVITDSTIAQNGYNAIEIGLSQTTEPPKSVLIDGVDFTGNMSNNAISIFGTADDAIVTISNCTFTKVSNAIRLSNRTNASGVIVNIENCQFTEWEAGQYAGAILCQDYTSTTAPNAQTNNLFGDGKIIINFINCTHAGQKIEFEDPATVCGSGDENQILYVYYDKGGLVAYDAAKFPVVNAF